MLESGLLKDQAIEVLNVNRVYHLFVLTNYIDAPIVMLFHGHSNGNNELLGLNGATAPFKIWLDIEAQEDIILIVPNGLFTSISKKGWNDCRADASTNSEADDVQFISLLMDFVIDKYQADSDRIYANGISNGGHFCIRLANEIPEKFTAFATIIASNTVNSECLDSEIPVSALFMNGTTDPFLPYTGGAMTSNRGEVFSVENTINYWVNKNETDLTPEMINLPDIDSNDDSSVEKLIYKNGINNTEVVLYKVINGGHTDPSKVERYSNAVSNILGNQNADIEMAEEVWAFFKNKTK